MQQGEEKELRSALYQRIAGSFKGPATHGFDKRKITARSIPEIKTEEYKENESHVQPSSTHQSTKERIDDGLQESLKSRGRQVMAVTSRGTKAEEYNQEDDHIPPPSAKTMEEDASQIVRWKKKNRKETEKNNLRITLPSVGMQVWFSPELAQMREKLVSLHHRSKLTQNSKLKTAYKDFKKDYSKQLLLAKNKFNAEFINTATNKSKAAWMLIKQEISSNIPHDIPIRPNILNNQFVTIIENILSEVQQPQCSPLTLLNNLKLSKNVFKWATPHKIIKIVKGFKSSKTRYAYGLTNELVKHVIHVIAFPLSVVFITCLQSGTFPDELEYTKTFSILKKRDPKDPDSYRPISVVPILVLVLEKTLDQSSCERELRKTLIEWGLNKRLNITFCLQSSE
ncbi:hypothetical protein J437_LFUL017674 [Ladona fulva]|uniref:Reverse transcriptase n=1 Tax=Ladona fulva TaxID=123851 RepID=A0A8K0KQS8_LADFU|nr:hypothetical protein J437_LFUL017674 [Ladona fulva]